MTARKVIRVVVTGKQRPMISPEDITRLVLALGRELAQRATEDGSKPAHVETAG